MYPKNTHTKIYKPALKLSITDIINAAGIIGKIPKSEIPTAQ
jgi:hypothetical protein